MNKEYYIKLAESKWPDLVARQREGDFYTYEKRFAAIMQELSLAVLQGHLGQAPPCGTTGKNASGPPSGR